MNRIPANVFSRRAALAGSLLCLLAISGPVTASDCAKVNALGSLYITNEQPPNCSVYLLLSAGDYDSLRNPFTAEIQWTNVVWASGATIVMWTVGVGLGAILNLLRKSRV